MDRYKISERSACGLAGLSRTAYHYMPLPPDDEEPDFLRERSSILFLFIGIEWKLKTANPCLYCFFSLIGIKKYHWCPRPESNRHAILVAQDFKSCVSTDFTTRAR